jgi:hypothetical protein
MSRGTTGAGSLATTAGGQAAGSWWGALRAGPSPGPSVARAASRRPPNDPETIQTTATCCTSAALPTRHHPGTPRRLGRGADRSKGAAMQLVRLCGVCLHAWIAKTAGQGWSMARGPSARDNRGQGRDVRGDRWHAPCRGRTCPGSAGVANPAGRRCSAACGSRRFIRRQGRRRQEAVVPTADPLPGRPGDSGKSRRSRPRLASIRASARRDGGARTQRY